MYERNAFARDRSSELIDEWDSIHLDGVSWLSSDGTVEMVCRTLGVTATWASDKSGARGVAQIDRHFIAGIPRIHGGMGLLAWIAMFG